MKAISRTYSNTVIMLTGWWIGQGGGTPGNTSARVISPGLPYTNASRVWNARILESPKRSNIG